ncbi:MAG: hypothetical protein M3119_07130 [Verrucomicrobiota bacterium]|nr:hypothetical protein [Verrucomicrobiota bacterium]MDQ6939916.1 hypothetical protein [Verrucomicrobiota bacterium]
MSNPSQAPARKSFMSAEAMIGTGITVWAFGILFLLLGWAQHMRQVKDAALILLVIGAVLFAVGGMIALAGAGKRKSG